MFSYYVNIYNSLKVKYNEKKIYNFISSKLVVLGRDPDPVQKKDPDHIFWISDQRIRFFI